MFAIKMGVPEMDELWSRLSAGASAGKLNLADSKLHKKWGKAMAHLAADPRHPGLQTHDIEALTRRYGVKVFQSYLENRTPKACRMYWVYGPGRAEITVIGLEPHPEDTKAAYEKVRLSALGEERR